MTTGDVDLAVILGRVSTEDQAEDGTGLPGQIEAGMAYITRRGYTLDMSVGFASQGIDHVPGVFQEDYTGKIALRPAIMALLDSIASHNIKVVVVHRTNRLGRRGSVQEVLEAEFRARGVRVEYVTAHFDTSTPIGRAMRRVSGTFDELDYENIIEQLRAGKFQRAKLGSVVTPRAPYGYRVVKEHDHNGKVLKQLVIYEPEADVVRRIYQWYIYGDETGKRLSIFAIARRLTEDGVPTRADSWYRKYSSGVWAESSVRLFLRSKVYTGVWHYGKVQRAEIPNEFRPNGKPRVAHHTTPPETWIPVEVPAIIDLADWEAAQQLLTQNKAKAARNRKNTYLFAGMLTCAACGRAYTGHYLKKSYAAYQCGGQRRIEHRCTQIYFREDELDAVVWEWIKSIVVDPDYVERVLQQREAEIEAQTGHLRSLVVSAERLIAEKIVEQNRLLALYQKSKLSEDRWEVADDLLAKEIADQDRHLAELRAQLARPHYEPKYLDTVKAACARIAAGIEQFDYHQKRETYELLDLTIRLAVEDGYRIAHAECVLDAKRLSVNRIASNVS
jgi:site-specific DNA recombinase